MTLDPASNLVDTSSPELVTSGRKKIVTTILGVNNLVFVFEILRNIAVMVKVVILAVLACAQLVLSGPIGAPKPRELDPEETALLVEFDRLFNKLHYDVDYKLRIYRMNHSLRLKNLNAQFISRYGFVVTDIQTMKFHVKDQILEHALDVIGDTQNACIVEKNDEAIRRATQAAQELSMVAEKIYGEMKRLSKVIMYPMVKDFQESSTKLQFAVSERMARDDIVKNLQLALADLAFLYLANANKVDRVIVTLDHEADMFQDMVNQLRLAVFKEIDAVASNYVYHMDQLLTDALQCA